MSFLEWDSKYEVGVPMIDNQHRRVVDHINQLHRAVENGDRLEVMDVLDQLVEYTVAHFGFEEAMQEKGQYPRAEEHKQVHQEFARKVDQYRQRFENGEDIAGKLLEELNIWFISHIQEEDADYVPYLKSNVGRDGFSAALSKFFG